MRLIFLGKETEGGNSPTLFDTDEDMFVIQGWTIDLETQAQLSPPEGETAVIVPKALMRHLPKSLLRQLLEEDDAAPDG